MLLGILVGPLKPSSHHLPNRQSYVSNGLRYYGTLTYVQPTSTERFPDTGKKMDA